MNPYEDGRDAAARGLSRADNPHAPDSSAWADWRRGFADQTTGAYSRAFVEGNVRLS